MADEKKKDDAKNNDEDSKAKTSGDDSKKEEDVQDKDGKDAPADLGDQIKKLSEVVNGHGKMIEKMMKGKYEAKDDKEDECVKKSKDGDSEQYAADESNEHDNEVGDMNKEQFAKIQSELEAVKEENAFLHRKAVTAEVRAKITYMKRAGVMFGSQEDEQSLVEELVNLSDDDARSQQYEKIEKHYRRVPVQGRISMEGTEEPLRYARTTEAGPGERAMFERMESAVKNGKN